MYHRIVSDTTLIVSDWHAISEIRFRKQLKLLDFLNYTPITFQDYQLYLDGRLSLPKKPIIITFDDAHKETFETAIPILNEFGMRAVIYAIGNRNLRYALWDQRHEVEKCSLMNNEQLIKAHEMGFEIGAHTMTHRTLTHLSNEEIVEEVGGSKYALEKVLGHRVISFAYPYGSYNSNIRSKVEEAGFAFACGGNTGPPQFCDDIYDIRRTVITNRMSLYSFLWRVLIPEKYLSWIPSYSSDKNKCEFGSEKRTKIPSVDYESTINNKSEPN